MIKKIIINIFYRVQKASYEASVKAMMKNGQLKVGNHTYGINNLMITSYKGSNANVVIGKYCSLAPNISIITGGIHPTNWISTYPFRIKWDMNGKFEDGMPYSKGDVIIGNDVWIGTGVTILSGIKIGHGSVIAAGSIVVKDVAPYAIIGGNPAKLIRFRFNEFDIERLLVTNWWDWNEEKVKENVSLINSESVDNFLEKNNQL